MSLTHHTYLRDVGSDEDPCWVPCAKGDPGSTLFTEQPDRGPFPWLAFFFFILLVLAGLFNLYDAGVRTGVAGCASAAVACEPGVSCGSLR